VSYYLCGRRFHIQDTTLNGLVGRLNHLGNDYVECKVAEMSIGLKVYTRDRHRTYKDHTITKINPDGSYNIHVNGTQ
jgi:hypothetical protein